MTEKCERTIKNTTRVDVLRFTIIINNILNAYRFFGNRNITQRYFCVIRLVQRDNIDR